MGFISGLESFMTWIGKEEKVLYTDIVTYLPSAAKIAELIFPQYAAEIATGTSTVIDATTLIQNAVTLVEHKYAASGAATGTGAQKSAEVIALAGAAVTSLLKSAGVTAPTTAYIQSIVDAVVAILNIPGTAPATTAATTPATATTTTTAPVAA